MAGRQVSMQSMGDEYSEYSQSDNGSFRLGDTKATQLWKTNDQKAQKSGPRHTVYWAKSGVKTSGLDMKKMWVTGDQYKGDWQDNKKHGRGTLNWHNNGKYEGEWASNKRNGEGTYWARTGKGTLRKEYTGEWVDNKRSGFGIRYYDGGNKYEGEWENNLRHGRGRQTYSDNNVYEGDWWDGKRSGYGILTQANGDRYEGHWVDDKKEGEGVFFFKKTGKRMDGEWVNDVCKCGSLSAAEDETDMLAVEEVPSAFYPRGKFELPKNHLKNSDGLLEERIVDIQRDRAAFRAKNGSMFDLFTSEELEAIRSAFSNVDVEGKGYIVVEEVRMIFSELEIYVDDGIVEKLLLELEMDPGGFVTFDDFVRLLFLFREFEEENQDYNDEAAEAAAVAAAEAAANDLDLEEESPSTEPSQEGF